MIGLMAIFYKHYHFYLSVYLSAEEQCNDTLMKTKYYHGVANLFSCCYFSAAKSG